MLWMFFIAAAFGGGIVVDANLPVEVLIEDQPYVKMFYPGQARFERDAGPVTLTLMVQGKPQRLNVEVPATGYAQIIVGRNGVSNGAPVPESTQEITSEVVFRTMGQETIQLRIGKERHIITPGKEFATVLSKGKHRIELRNIDGTLIWARGHLDLSGQQDVVVQMLAGRLPEVVGQGSQFLITDG